MGEEHDQGTRYDTLAKGLPLLSTLSCCPHWFKGCQTGASKAPSPKMCSNFASGQLPLAFVMAWVFLIPYPKISRLPTIKSTKLLSPWHQF